MQTTSLEVQARRALLRECARPRVSPPWEFLTATDDVFAACPHPKETLARLQQEFDLEALRRAGIAVRDDWGGWQLAAALCNPTGAIVPVSAHETGGPQELWTGRGQLSTSKHPAMAVMQDATSAALAEKTGVVFAVSCIQEVLLLRSLGFAAVTGRGLGRLTWEELREFDGTFGEGVPLRPGKSDEEFDCEDSDAPVEESLAFTEDGPWASVPEYEESTRPAIVLLGFSLSPLCAAAPVWVANAARHFSMARERGLSLSGVWVACPQGELLDHLEFAVRHRDGIAIRNLLMNSVDGGVDFEQIQQPQEVVAVTTDYLTAFEALRACYLPENFAAGDRLEEAEANRKLQRAVDDELWRPLVDWAMRWHDPVIRNAGVQLAAVARMLHESAPRLSIYDDSGQFPTSEKHFEQYMHALDRFTRLIMTINKAMK